MSHSTRSARAVAVVAAILCGAVATTSPSSAHAQQADPCGPLGELFELELNDRCDFIDNDMKDHPENVTAEDIVAGLAQTGLFARMIECRDGTTVPVVARPNELLVTADTPVALVRGLIVLRERLPNSIVGLRPLNALAALVRVTPGTINEEFMRGTIPTLQGEDFSVDLNYLEPAQPNNAFRPGDDPVAADAASMGRGGRGRVLVVDSPSEPGAHPPVPEPDLVLSTIGPSVIYDVDGNGRIDEDHGHGTYVASLVKRLAPGAEVVLAGVAGQELRRSGRWTPMMFSDSDLIRTLDAAFGLSPLGRVTRRTFDVVNLSLGGAGCDVAARLALGRFMRDLAVIASQRGALPIYVAAAGNDGLDVKHFPAAFRDFDTMKAAWEAIGDPVAVPAAAAIKQLHADLADGMVAVGSWTDGLVRDPFSNCGAWVNGIAAGARQTSRYPIATSWATWSGTSFATPRVSAALVGGADLDDVKLDDPDTMIDVGDC